MRQVAQSSVSDRALLMYLPRYLSFLQILYLLKNQSVALAFLFIEQASYNAYLYGLWLSQAAQSIFFVGQLTIEIQSCLFPAVR